MRRGVLAGDDPQTSKLSLPLKQQQDSPGRTHKDGGGDTGLVMTGAGIRNSGLIPAPAESQERNILAVAGCELIER